MTTTCTTNHGSVACRVAFVSMAMVLPEPPATRLSASIVVQPSVMAPITAAPNLTHPMREGTSPTCSSGVAPEPRPMATPSAINTRLEPVT